ncbi:hypothetical protein GC093_28330 [Paenibacillus sp. LMG 31456]|uniref:Uncharacterized protein n=1 Tax=Paenibacillus foliorum TaxID=2654974 RepID=A0A972K5J5_9BACL|nr:hypothetical protein [Paenibacillus foliorum]NOU97102.1 hypothetical protein [Paenibacillus foliorum]
MDKKKRTRAQQASVSSTRGGASRKAAASKGRNGRGPAKAYKPYKKLAARPSRTNRNFIEDEDVLERQSEMEENMEASAAAAPANTGASVLGGFGGIDGIISMMGKANQMFKLFQQMGPIFKMFSMFGGGAKLSTASVRMNRMNQKNRSYKFSSKPIARVGANRSARISRTKR